MKIIDRLIICVVLALVAFVVCGCDESPAEAGDCGTISGDCPICKDYCRRPEPNEHFKDKEQ